MEDLIGIPNKNFSKEMVDRRCFPSKIGGKPAWLIPDPIIVVCSKCKNKMIFLLQLYAGKEEERSFHRCLYVFVCQVCNEFKVFRCQLPKINDFYSADPVDYKIIDSEDPLIDNLSCRKCGQFCEEDEHADCDCFSEYEIIVEDCESDDEDAIYTAELLTRYQQSLKDNSTLDDEEALVFEQICSELCSRDKVFDEFLRFSKKAPKHVIRYSDGGAIIWHNSRNQLNTVLPKCEECGGDRKFEFQIQPQIIHLLQSTMDFGVVGIYTCKHNCVSKSSYMTEFCYVQPE
eukprot:GHVL01010996.1.p1 GENE.GHVL01010996.1~~GHVL01010996.1.p1  ORF type:complete len:288 (+),score=42.47 GHVL01010996.1:31-894(+)